MSTATHILLRADVSVIPERFARAVSDIWESASQRYQQRRAIRHLSSLSDHHLKDIGIHRSEITSVVYEKSSGRIGHTRIY